MFGKKRRKELELKCTALEAKLGELTREREKLRAENERLISRERLVTEALTQAAGTAERIKTDAERYYSDKIDDSERDAEKTRREANELMQDAKHKADSIIDDADAEGRKRLREMGEVIMGYAEIVRNYNETVKESVRQAERNARQYAEFYNKLTRELPELLAPGAKAEGLEFTGEAVCGEQLWTVDGVLDEESTAGEEAEPITTECQAEGPTINTEKTGEI